jgi:hypothetical protein
MKVEFTEEMIKRVAEDDPTHFDNSENRAKLEKLINSLDYFSCFQ